MTCPLKFRFLTNLDICLSACGARFLGLKVYKQQCKIENKIILLMFLISLTYSTRWKTNFPSPNSQIQSYPQKMRPQNISICCDQRFKFSCFNQTSLFSKNHNLRRILNLFNFLSICIGLIDTNRYCSCVYISCNVATPPPSPHPGKCLD